MRILIACEWYYPSVGGVQEVMRQVAERLVLRGHDVTVATTYMPDRRSNRINGVAIAGFKARGRAVGGMSGDLDGYRRLVLAGDYDVLMVKAAQQWTFDALLPIIDRIPRPKVFIPCGFSSLYEPDFSGYYREMPGILGRFDHLIFYAADYRDVNMARGHGLSRFTIVPNGASEVEFGAARDPSFRVRHGIPADAFVILTVGALTGMKGHRELANAFALADFGGRPAVLILNGNVMTRPAPIRRSQLMALARRGARRLRRLARGQPATRPAQLLEVLANRINEQDASKHAMVVDLPRPELIQAYLNSNLFVFASNVEYSPLVLYEAAAAGLPFLTVPVGNAAEIAQWTGGGVVCPAPQDERGYTHVDPAALAERISRLAADPATLATLGSAGRQAWSDRFTWNSITDRYEAILAGVCGKEG